MITVCLFEGTAEQQMERLEKLIRDAGLRAELHDDERDLHRYVQPRRQEQEGSK